MVFNALPAVRRFVLSCLLVLWGSVAAAVEPPPAAKVLPENTVAYLSVADSNDLVERFLNTAAGKMVKEPQMNRLFSQLWEELQEAAAPLEVRLGLSLNDLLSIPQGELALALVAPKGAPPAAVLLLEVKEQFLAIEMLLKKADAALRENGATVEQKMLGKTKATLYKIPGTQQRQVTYFHRDGALVLGTNLDVLQQVVDAWDGKKATTLADNKKFTTIRDRCRVGENVASQMTWFVDPIELIDSLTQNNDAAQFALALLEPVGLNGLRGVGGTITLATEDFDNIAHVHVLMDSPRKGVLKVFALGGGDILPERWVPHDAATYTTFHWDVKTSFEEVASLADMFLGKGATAGNVERFFGRFNLDFEKDVLAHLENRFTLTSWFQKPVTNASQMQLFGIQLKEPSNFEEKLDGVLGRFTERFETKSFAGVSYRQFIQRRPDPDDGRPPRPRPCVAVLGGYLLISNRPAIMESAIRASRNSKQSLANAADFQLIAERAQKQGGERQLAMLSFNRPEEGMRFLYDLATKEENRRNLRRFAETNRVADAFHRALNKNPLPPFEKLRSFLAPAGALVIDDATGIHYIAFGLKPKE